LLPFGAARQHGSRLYDASISPWFEFLAGLKRPGMSFQEKCCLFAGASWPQGAGTDRRARPVRSLFGRNHRASGPNTSGCGAETSRHAFSYSTTTNRLVMPMLHRGRGKNIAQAPIERQALQESSLRTGKTGVAAIRRGKPGEEGQSKLARGYLPPPDFARYLLVNFHRRLIYLFSGRAWDIRSLSESANIPPSAASLAALGMQLLQLKVSILLAGASLKRWVFLSRRGR